MDYMNFIDEMQSRKPKKKEQVSLSWIGKSLIYLQLIFIILKMFNVVSWNIWIVSIPMLIIGSLFALQIVLTLIVGILCLIMGE